MKPLLLTLCALLLSAALPLPAQTPSTPDPTGARAWTAHGLTPEQRDSIHAALQWGLENKFVPGGSLLIIHRGEPVFREGFGVADLETKQPFLVDAPCRIASVTKLHTATLLAMLVSEGKIAWDDPVDKYLPSFASLTVSGKGKTSRPPKIRELLCHTAGFAGNDNRREGAPKYKPGQTLADAVEDIAQDGLVTEPGTVFAYTGTGYSVAGRIAEVVSGEELGKLMRARLFDPVGAATAVFQPQASDELQQRMPTSYERSRAGLTPMDMEARREQGPSFPAPGGGLISTVDDVGRVLLLHRNHGQVDGKQLVSAEALQAQYRPQPATGRTGYGFGFNIMHRDANGVGDRVRHLGASGTVAFMDFNSDCIFVLLTQVPTRQIQPFQDRVAKAISTVFIKP